MIRAFVLGLHLAVAGGRSGLARLALMVSGSALAAFVVLTSVGLTGIAARQEAREQHIAPLTELSGLVPTPEGGTIVGDVIGDGWDGRELRRYLLATADSGGPVPPGVPRLPRPGEVLLSPALAALVADEPAVAARFPQVQGPVISEDGLVAPDQLLAYVGVERDELGPFVTEYRGFGDPNARARLDPRAARTIGLLIVLTLVAPVIMFMAACARLSATARGQRLAALRLLGLTARRTQLVNAGETATVATAGSVIGLAAWLTWRQTMPSIRVGAFAWFSSDLHLPPSRIALVLAGLVAVSMLTAAVGSAPGITQPLRVRRERSSRRVSAWRAVPVIVGVGLLAVSWATAEGTSADFITWMLPFGVGLTLTAIGLVLAMPFAAVALGRLLARSDRPAVLLAAGGLRHEPAVAGRVTAALAVALFAAGVAQVVASSLDRHDDETRSSLLPVVNVEVIGAETDVATYRALSDVGVVMPQWSVGPFGAQIDAVVATCEQLQRATLDPLPTCRDDRIHRVDRGLDLSDVPRGDEDVDAVLAQAGLPPIDGHLAVTLPFVDGSYTPQLIVPPELGPDTGTNFLVAMTGEHYDPQVITAELATVSSTARWNPMITYVDRLDTPRIYRGLIAVGTVAALLIGVAALVVATIDRALERRRALAHLRAIGAPTRTIRRALALQVLPVSLFMLILSGTAAVIGGSSYLRWGYPDEALPAAALGRLIVLSTAAALLATAAAVISASLRSPRQVLRQE